FMCDTLSADITLVLDTNLSYAGMRTGPSPVRISGDTLVWHFTTAASLFDFSGYIKVVVDTTATIFDTLQNRLYVTPTRITDPDTTNNYYTWREQIRSSYDPNEKQVSPAGYGPQGYIPNGTPLSYIIHFQNTGTAPARNITVSDTISEHLDFSTLQVVSSSFPVLVYQVAGNVVKFKFNGINLPDSTSDPVGSIGYIAYNIVPYDSLAPGTQIRNTAGIYFDYNPAVYTNGTLNTIEDSIGTITGLDSVCAGGTMVLHNRVAGGRWAASNGRATVNDTGLVTGITSGRDTITYTLYGHQTASKVIFVNTPPVTVSISGRDSVCTGASLLLTASTPGGTWLSTGTGIVSVSAVGRLAGLSPGTDTVWYTVANTCGIAADSLPVFVRTVPGTPSLSGPSTVCEGASITLSSSIAGGTWRAAGSHLSVTGGVVAASSAGTDTVEYTVTNMCGAASVQATINILPLPVAATITGPASFCNGTVAAYSASSTGGTWTHSTPSVASLSGGSLYGLAPGSDTLFYALSNTCGTTTTYTVTTVTTVPATPAVLAPPAVCVGGTVALSSVPTGGVWRASSLSSGLVALSGSTASGVRAGSDSLFYTVANSCGTTSAHLIITIDTYRRHYHRRRYCVRWQLYPVFS
ncbi:MAG: hypothetical protein EBZ77_08570, partial [Chitinophagia bacterium]|nr:hypothetical protein [Chitinophagia bacterium]